MGSRSRFPVLICPSQCTAPQSSQFWVANHDMLDLVGSDHEFLQISCRDISSERCGLWNALSVLRFSRAEHHEVTPSWYYVVLDWESVQSPLVKIWAGFAFKEEMSTSAIDNSLIPLKAFWALYAWYSFAQLEQLYTAHFTNHRLGIVAEWLVGVILLQIGLKCFSVRMTLDLLHEFANTEVFCLFHNCMWQSRHSEVNVIFPRAVWTNRWIVHFSQVSPFSFDLRLRFRLRLCLDLNA